MVLFYSPSFPLLMLFTFYSRAIELHVHCKDLHLGGSKELFPILGVKMVINLSPVVNCSGDILVIIAHHWSAALFLTVPFCLCACSWNAQALQRAEDRHAAIALPM